MPELHLSIEPSLLERTVFTATRAEPALADEYQRAFAACYRHPEGAARDEAFAELHDRWFDRLGLRRRILDRVHDMPRIRTEVRRLLVSDARARGRSAVELFGKPGGYAVAMAVTPSLLLDAAVFDYWSRYELQHVEDMLDPDFAYDRAATATDPSAAAENRTRERYALLWSVTIDARLRDLPTAPPGLRERRGTELARAFGLSDPPARDAAIEMLWPAASVATRPTHPTLLAWACNGMPGLAATARTDPRATAVRAGGSACPLCRFPTFDWSEAAALSDGMCSTIRADFPAWRPDAGLCGRCAELYRSRMPTRAAAPTMA